MSLSPVRPVLAAVVVALAAFAGRVEADGGVGDDCAFEGIPLYGDVKVVTNFPDITVKRVDNFADLHVTFVENFPDTCGKWRIVENFPDFTIKYVENFPDITIKEVTNFPGVP